MAERVKVVEERRQVGGSEVDRAYARQTWLEVTSADNNIVREDICMVSGGSILEVRLPHARTVAIDER
jgi:hypothetical protein